MPMKHISSATYFWTNK